MPNGKPGDHPYSDMVLHHEDFGVPEIARRVRRLHKIGSPEVRRLVSDLVGMMTSGVGAGRDDGHNSTLAMHLDTIEKLIEEAPTTSGQGSRP